MKPTHHIIVIGREFGSRGRETGKALAAALGIPYYDKELLAEAADTLGYSRSIFTQADECRPSMLRSLMGCSYGSSLYGIEELSRENLYEAQCSVIRSIAEKGPCVIVGRTADYVNREMPGLLSIFIHAPLPYRTRRVAESEHCDEKHAEALIRKRDRLREKYYNYFTGRQWGRASNYDLTFDSSRLSTPAIVALVRQYLDAREEARS